MLLDINQLKQKYNMKVTGIMHIGAHYGEEYNDYRKTFGDIPIVMWEAGADNFKKLQENIPSTDSNVTLINKGVGSFECTVSMFKETANMGQSNSMLKPLLHEKQYPGIVFNEAETVKIYPLDKWECGKQLNMINIDIQGFELHAFLGAKKTLRNVDYIITEINRAELYENCALEEELDWFLGRYGLKRVETNWAGNTWGDAFYIRQ